MIYSFNADVFIMYMKPLIHFCFAFIERRGDENGIKPILIHFQYDI